MDHNVNIWYEGYMTYDPKHVMTHRLTTSAKCFQSISISTRGAHLSSRHASHTIETKIAILEFFHRFCYSWWLSPGCMSPNKNHATVVQNCTTTVVHTTVVQTHTNTLHKGKENCIRDHWLGFHLQGCKNRHLLVVYHGLKIPKKL